MARSAAAAASRSSPSAPAQVELLEKARRPAAHQVFAGAGGGLLEELEGQPHHPEHVFPAGAGHQLAHVQEAVRHRPLADVGGRPVVDQARVDPLEVVRVPLLEVERGRLVEPAPAPARQPLAHQLAQKAAREAQLAAAQGPAPAVRPRGRGPPIEEADEPPAPPCRGRVSSSSRPSASSRSMVSSSPSSPFFAGQRLEVAHRKAAAQHRRQLQQHGRRLGQPLQPHLERLLQGGRHGAQAAGIEVAPSTTAQLAGVVARAGRPSGPARAPARR